jgi:hypothetical protein
MSNALKIFDIAGRSDQTFGIHEGGHIEYLILLFERMQGDSTVEVFNVLTKLA